MLFFRFIIPLLFIQVSFAQETYDFAIYHDNNVGAWEDGIIAFEQFLDWKEVSHHRVTAHDINTVVLKDYYKAISFPGGDADYYNADINAIGVQHILDLINNNGAYIGFCAGAEFACDKLVWEGVTYDYPLNLFQGESIGPIDELAVWPDYDMATLTMNSENEINQFEPQNEDMLYWGGSVFNPYPNTEYSTVATFDGYYNLPAIINFTYGTGRVLLLSPHPEIEEDSDRDLTNICQELDDNGTDWNFLWAATDWLLGNPITEPDILSNTDFFYSSEIIISPNPTNSILNISVKKNQTIRNITIFNLQGQEIYYQNNPNNSINLSFLPKGIYLITLKIEDEKVTKKLFII